MRYQRLVLVLFIVFNVVVPIVTFAANPCSIPEDGKPLLGACVNQVYIWSIGVAGLLALLMIVIGGYTYMTAAGNAQRAAKGKDFIMSALLGVALLLVAFLLLKTINSQLVELNTNSINTTTNAPE